MVSLGIGFWLRVHGGKEGGRVKGGGRPMTLQCSLHCQNDIKISISPRKVQKYY